MAPELQTQCSLQTQTWGPWTICTLYQQGLRHAQAGTPCDDAFLILPFQDHLFLAVADGVSTCPFGRQGAQLAVTGLAAHIDSALQKGKPHPDLLAHAMAHAHLTIRSEAMRAGTNILDYSTTLGAVLISPTTVRAANIGDSSLAQLTKVSSSAMPEDAVILPLCSAPQYDGGPTVHPITVPDWNAYLQTAHHPVDLIEAVILATDGAEEFIKDGTELAGQSPLTARLALALRDSMSELPPRMLPTWLAGYLEGYEAVNDDDRTLIVAFKHTPSVS